MSERKLQRTYRTTPRSPDEVARDEQLRRQIMQEFPPADSSTADDSLSETLRSAIESSPRPISELCSDARVSQTLVTRFLAGERDLHLAVASRLTKTLGLELTAK